MLRRILITACPPLLASACAGLPGPAPIPDADGKVSVYVEHRVSDCSASANQARCIEDGHWHYRISDRVLATQEQLCHGLHELAQRYPDPAARPDEPFYSSVSLEVRPQDGASYYSMQRVFQLASLAGFYKIETIGPKSQHGQRKGAPRSSDPAVNIALHWDPRNRCTTYEVASRPVRDATEFEAAIEAAFAGDQLPTFELQVDDLVPWSEVFRVLDQTRGTKLEFAAEKRFR
ncbi:MAG: hypothetical protein Q7T30_02630 [Planctomycetota bacterium]|nr:hypothetical protein [Planctomycetota bacterium]